MSTGQKRKGMEFEVYFFREGKAISKTLKGVSEDNYPMVKPALIRERKLIISYLKDLREKDIIKSVFRPKNRKMQEALDELVHAKKVLSKVIDQITIIYK